MSTHTETPAHAQPNPSQRERPRSWWSTALSLSIHGSLIALLWSAPSLPINTPEVAPPESIDATILPPPPAEEKAPDKTAAATPAAPAPSTHTPASNPAKTATADKPPAPAPSGTPQANTSASNAANGTQASAGQPDGKGGTGTGANTNGTGASKKLSAGAPVAVAPSGGFQINYDLDASGANIKVVGGGQLIFNRKGDRYISNLNAHGSGIVFTAHSEGTLRSNTIASERFSDLFDVPLFNKKDKQSSFSVDYQNNKVIFTNKGSTFEQELTYDVLYDYMSAIVYLQAGFQQGQLNAGQGTISLPIGKRQEIDQARISIGNFEYMQVVETASDAIPVNISINSGSIKFIRVWFFPNKNYLPLKMEIGIDKYTVVLLSRKSG